MEKEYTFPNHAKFKTNTWRSIYLGTSIAFGTVVVLLALKNTSWSDFLNAHPHRGEMGLGRFIIRGTRYIEGKSTPFAYAWRQVEPTSMGRGTAWCGYGVHQLVQWGILAQAQRSNEQQWSPAYRWWNWRMLYLNAFMLVFKLVHTQLFYDGLAIDVPEGTAQSSVVAILVIALILAIPTRGIAFGLGRQLRSPSFQQVLQFIRKYHGYLVSFGTVYNFHYHPAEGTMGHYFGFIYQVMLLWQSTTFLHNSHRDKAWILLLEVWVFVHGTLTALCQPGDVWQIFSFGFAAIFLIHQIYWTPLATSFHRLAFAYGIYSMAVLIAFYQDKKYFRIAFIPAAEFLSMFFCLGVGMTVSIVTRSSLLSQRSVPVFVGTMFIVTGVVLVVGLACLLGGSLRVYNDY
ncbi:hypothetical protein BDF14DRAFT_1756716 [Spinellus fusiger]|nr:hypothetical protein BDF14DRAFT_1756716 [Spinellus fusiger]